MNFCSNCGHDLRAIGPNLHALDRCVGATAFMEPRILEHAPPVIKPVPKAPTREDFDTEEGWKEFRAVSRTTHHQNRLEAAMESWKRDHPHGEAAPEENELLEWYLGTSRRDGATGK